MTEEQIEQKSVIYTDNLKPSIGKFDGEEAYSWNQVSDAWIDGYKECQKEHEWHYVKDKLPPSGETVSLYFGTDIMGKAILCTGCVDCKGNWYKNVDKEPFMWQEIILPKENE